MKSIHAISTILAVWGMGSSGLDTGEPLVAPGRNDEAC